MHTDAPPAIVWHYPAVAMPTLLPNHSVPLEEKFTLSYTCPAEELDLEYAIDGRYVFYAYTRGAPALTGRIPLVFTIPPNPPPLGDYDLHAIALNSLTWLDVTPTETPGLFNLVFVAIPNPEDIDRDGAVTAQDFFDFQVLFFENDLAADFTLDGRVDSADFFDFVNRWLGA